MTGNPLGDLMPELTPTERRVLELLLEHETVPSALLAALWGDWQGGHPVHINVWRMRPKLARRGWWIARYGPRAHLGTYALVPLL